jgi:hypothetical protein
MGKHELGKRYRCYSCGCAFYDLKKTKAICPRCSADQSHAPKVEIPTETKASRSKEKIVLPLPDEEENIPEEFDEFADVIVDEDEVDFTEEDDE